MLFKNDVSQRTDELTRFIELLINEQVRSYLEIGLRIGSTFSMVGSHLPKQSVLVGIDLPGAAGGVCPHDVAAAIEEVERIATQLRHRQQTVTIIWGDSRSPETVGRARSFAPYDAVLIDGDHSIEGVRADWDTYSPMARIVALHDIDAGSGKRYGVPELWNELKSRGYRHCEIIGAKRGMGVGVVWMREA